MSKKITKKVASNKYEFNGHASTPSQSKRIYLGWSVGHVIGTGLRYDIVSLIGVRVYNQFGGKYETSFSRIPLTDVFELRISLPNRMLAADAKKLVTQLRKDVLKYDKMLTPFVKISK